MVNLIRRAGWVKSILTSLALVFAIIGAVWAAGEKVDGRVEKVIDVKIEVHRLQSEGEMNRQFEAVRHQQAITDTKVDMILERLPK